MQDKARMKVGGSGVLSSDELGIIEFDSVVGVLGRLGLRQGRPAGVLARFSELLEV